MSTRISGGEFRGRILESPEGSSTRPTSNKIRQALFSTLGQNMTGVAFYDVYAGSGAVGIEALSRGADHAIFVEHNQTAIAKIKLNLSQLGLLSKSTVIQDDAYDYLTRVEPLSNSIVFIDPPFVPDYPDMTEVLERLSKENDIVVQYPKTIESSFQKYFSKIKCYGVSCLGYYFKDEL